MARGPKGEGRDGPSDRRARLRLVTPDEPAPAPPPGLSRRFWRDLLLGGGLAVLVALLGWGITVAALADRDSLDYPQDALAVRATDALALASLADRRMAAGDAGSAQALARRAIVADPMELTAFRTLAQAAVARGRMAEADALMTIAGRRAKRDRPAQLWLLQRRAAQGRFREAVAHADGLMRAWPIEMRAPVTRMLSLMAVDPAAGKAIAADLATDPPWRTRFLIDLSRGTSDLAAPFTVFSALQDSKRPPRDIELQAYIDRLVRERLYQAAYVTWVQLLPQDGMKGLGDLYDGRFDGLPGPPPFNWQLPRLKGASVELAPVPQGPGGGALRLSFSGRPAPVVLARQLLVLPPGRYRLLGQARTENFVSAAGLTWTLRCAEGSKALAGETGAINESPGWAPIAAEFEVRPGDCSAQWLTLEQAAHRPIATRGDIWFDDLQILRAG
jgi:hypothetical protein